MEEQLQQWLSQQPPEMLYGFIQLILNTPPEKLQQMISELEAEIQGGGEQQEAAPTQPSEEEMGQANLYG